MKHTRWLLPPADSEKVTRVMIETGISRPMAMMLVSRGFDTKKKIARVMRPAWPCWETQYCIPDFEKAITRIRHAVENKEKILVYGDRDVDGVTGTVILVQTLQDLGADAVWYVPGEEGYGLNEAVLSSFCESIKLVITVDCGITAFSEAQFLKRNRVELIITDHHTPFREIPDAYAVINPKLGDHYPDHDLAGCGVALIVAQALMLTYSKYYDDRIVALVEKENRWEVCVIEKFRPVEDDRIITDLHSLHHSLIIVENESARHALIGFFDYPPDTGLVTVCGGNGKGSAQDLAHGWISRQVYENIRMKYFLNQMAVYAALGCLADMVPLHGINRCMVRQGLDAFRHSSRPGIQALNRYYNIDMKPSAQALPSTLLTWKYIPLLNAAGRCGRASRAVELLLTENTQQAFRIIRELNHLNQERKNLQEENTKKFELLLKEQYLPDKDKLIFLTAHAIPHGVSGLIAYRLIKKFYKPVALLIQQEDIIVGTIRSCAGFNVLSALETCKDLLITYGGHQKAAGFRLSSEQLNMFKKRLLAYAASTIQDDDLIPTYTVDGEVTLGDIDDIILDELRMFEPFGSGWEYPSFSIKDLKVDNIRPIGSSHKHITMKLHGHHSVCNAVAWGMGDRGQEFAHDTLWDIVVKLEVHLSGGRAARRLTVVDIKPSLVESLV